LLPWCQKLLTKYIDNHHDVPPFLNFHKWRCFHGTMHTKKVIVWQFSLQYIFMCLSRYLEKIL
jgi:hypothetical protein